MSDNKISPHARSPYDGVEAEPLTRLSEATSAAITNERIRFHAELDSAGQLDAAFIRRRSDTLVVTFHGLLDREKFTIPRFERARMTEEFAVSCLYWADPSLWLDSELSLAWYTGAGELDLAALLANYSMDVSKSIGARRIIFSGSSGGGFAALQVSALVPGSTALVFNPQTAISRYWPQAQRKYLQVCAPANLSISVDDFDFSGDWSEGLGDQYSAVRRYSLPVRNNVIYWSNINDWHHTKHLRPFEAAVESSPNKSDTLSVREYDGPKGHNVPTVELFREALAECLSTDYSLTQSD